MSGFVVMVRKPAGRARPIYPVRMSWRMDGRAVRTCGGSTYGLIGSFGQTTRPISFLCKDDADWFCGWLTKHYSYIERAYDVFVKERAA